MPSINFNNFIKNPIVHSLYVENFDESVIAPGNPKFIATEDFSTITTETGIGLITEK